MARIRSIHPSLFTDEAYMELSLAGKAVWPGIWTDADDGGVFEWKPLTLKARLMPCEQLDMATLLLEFVDKGLAIKFEVEGKQYGAIKNFCRWQRPKSPTYRHPRPEQVALFVDISHRDTEGLPKASPTSTPLPSLRKDGGDAMEDERGMEDRAFALFCESAGRQGWTKPRALDARRRGQLRIRLRDGGGIDAWIEMLAKAEPSDFLRTGNFFTFDWVLKPANFTKVLDGNYVNKTAAPVARALSFDERKAQASSAVVDHDSEDQWRVRMRGYKPGGWWPVGQWGPRPFETGCRVPQSLLSGVGT